MGATLAASNMFALSITQTFTTPTAGTEISDSASNHAFNYFGAYGLSGYHLDSVTLRFQGTESIVNLAVTNNIGSQQYYTYLVTGNLVVDSNANQNSNGAGALNSTDLNLLNAASLSGNVFGVGNAASCDMGIGIGVTQTWFTGGVASGLNRTNQGATPASGFTTPCTPNLINPSGILSVDSGTVSGTTAAYLASGQFNLSYLTGTTAGGANQNLQNGFTGSTTSTGTYTVVYNYSIVSGTPEPATMLLVGSALVGLGFMRRRKA